MATGQLITAARFNAMQAKAAAILGNGQGEFGYGQTLRSSLVSASTDLAEAADMNLLRLDLINSYVHQTGSLPAINELSVGNEITNADYAAYEAIADYIYLNKNSIFETTQATVESKLTSVRNTQWGGSSQVQTLYHKFIVTFNNVNHRRHFFNAGGEIRFAASLAGGSTLKESNWASILSAMGTIKFNHTTVVASSGLSAGIGNFDLTSNFQTIYTKAPATYFYSTNDYVIKARGAQTSNVIEFSIEFTDGTRGNVDDPVGGTLTSAVTQLRPTGIYVEVPTPIYTTNQTIS